MIQIWIILTNIAEKPDNDLDMDHRKNLPENLEEINNIKELGRIVAETRKASHLTQEQLAARAGVSRRFVYQLENASRDSFPLGKVLLLLRRMNLELCIGRRTSE
jgi:DNA-binding XRE family transcriptional regulator